MQQWSGTTDTAGLRLERIDTRGRSLPIRLGYAGNPANQDNPEAAAMIFTAVISALARSVTVTPPID